MSISAIINSIQPSVANQTIQGSAVGDDSSPLANAYVMLVKPTNQSNNNFVLQPIKIATTDSQGNFQFDNLPPGEYQTIVEQTPAAAAPAAYIDPNAVSPQLSDNYVVFNEDLNSEIKPKIRNDHIGSIVGLPVPNNVQWSGPPTVTVLGNCTIPAQVRCEVMITQSEFSPPIYSIIQYVIENPGQGYSIRGTDGNIGTEGSFAWQVSGSDITYGAVTLVSASQHHPLAVGGGGFNDTYYISIQTNGARDYAENLPVGFFAVWPLLATEPGDFNRWVSFYASNRRFLAFNTEGAEVEYCSQNDLGPGGWWRSESGMVLHGKPISGIPTCSEIPFPLIRPYTLQTPGTGIANVDIAQNNSSTLPNLEQNYGLAQFINGLQQAFAQGISAAVVGTVGEVTGTVDGAPLYFDMIYGNNSVQSALRAGEFGDPNSAEARAIVNDLKGYLGKEFLVRPVFISGHVQNVLSAAQTFNTNTRVQSGLSGLISESIVLFAAAVANSLYQGAQAIDNAVSGVSPNLYNSISREWRGLKQQSWGAAQVNPPSWLVNKSFQSSLSTGQTVTYAFNPGGYTRTVSP